MKDCILKQQLPDLKTAVKRADVNLETWSKSGDSARHASHGACSCSHLLQFLPVNLTLDFVQNTTNAVEQGASWVLEDPVHALHLQSQLDATWLQQLKDAPVLYGEEQERTMVMLSAGLPEAYHPFLKDSPSSPLPVPVPVLEKKDSNDEAVAAEVESRFKISPVVAAMSLSKLWPPLETAASSSGADGLVPPLEPPKAIIAQGVLTSVPSFAPPTTKDALMTMTDGGDDTNKAHPEITASSSGATTVAAVVATGPTPMSKQDIFKPVVEDEKAPESKPITAVPDLGVSASFMTTTEAAANPPAVPSVTMLQPVTANASTAYVTASPAPPSPTTTTANPVLTASALALAAEPALTTSMLPILTKTEDKPPLMSTDQPSASDVAVTAAEPPPPAASISPTAVSSPFETNLPDPTATNLPVTAPLVAATTSVSPNLVDSLPDVASTYELSDARYWGLHAEEDQIRILRRSLMAKRAPIVKKKATQSSKKRKNNEGKPINLVQLSAWKSKPVVQLTAEELAAWEEGYRKGKTQVELWMEHYRLSRELYWDEQRQSRRPQTSMATFGSLEPNASQVRSCQLCRSPQDKRVWRCGASGHIRRDFSGDDLMQCLECSFVGCAPVCAASGSRQHILQHMLLSNHKFGKLIAVSMQSGKLFVCSVSPILCVFVVMLQPSHVDPRRRSIASNAGTMCITRSLIKRRNVWISLKSFHRMHGTKAPYSAVLILSGSFIFRTKGLFGKEWLRRIRFWSPRIMCSQLDCLGSVRSCSREKWKSYHFWRHRMPRRLPLGTAKNVSRSARAFCRSFHSSAGGTSHFALLVSLERKMENQSSSRHVQSRQYMLHERHSPVSNQLRSFPKIFFA